MTELKMPDILQIDHNTTGSDQTTPLIIEQDNKELSTRDQIEDEFIIYLSQCPTVKEAGLKAGYSPSYCDGTIYNKFKSERFLKKIRKHYNGHTHALLPRIIQAESKVIDIILADPEKLAKFRHTVTELKRSAGVLDQENTTKPPVIKIGNVKNLLLNAHDG
jgi:hypothetical protein